MTALGCTMWEAGWGNFACYLLCMLRFPVPLHSLQQCNVAALLTGICPTHVAQQPEFKPHGSNCHCPPQKHHHKIQEAHPCISEHAGYACAQHHVLQASTSQCCPCHAGHARPASTKHWWRCGQPKLRTVNDIPADGTCNTGVEGQHEKPGLQVVGC
jgi:hypothetical protein